MMKALLIIDVQHDYFPGGRCELSGPEKALEHISSVLRRFREAGLPVIYVQHVNDRPDAAFLLPDTDGVKIHSGIAPQAGEEVVVKHAPNSFYGTGLAELLRSMLVDELVVCGMMTHMCIDTTVRAARDYPFPVTLLYDACATKELDIMGKTIPAETVHNAYMAGLNGTFARVLITGELEM